MALAVVVVVVLVANNSSSSSSGSRAAVGLVFFFVVVVVVAIVVVVVVVVVLVVVVVVVVVVVSVAVVVVVVVRSDSSSRSGRLKLCHGQTMAEKTCSLTECMQCFCGAQYSLKESGEKTWLSRTAECRDLCTAPCPHQSSGANARQNSNR